MKDLFSDRPITSEDSDRFERYSFAKNLARALCLPPRGAGFVVAIEGGWGTGKTSILNLVETFLQTEDPPPLITRFDPWLLSGSKSLIESFLVQFAATLGKVPRSEKAVRAVQRVLKFAQLLGPVKLIPGAEPWGSIVQKVLESIGESTNAVAELTRLDLHAKKEEIAESIRELNRPVVVMIDDIDRLEPIEIRQIFQLVKAVADFERVSYLLAYDSGPVYKALSYENTYDGRLFAEKIVQVAYTIPQISLEQLRSFLNDRLQSFSLEYHIELEQFERDRLDSGLKRGGATRALRNVRDVSRLVNRLRISVPSTRGEVNFADIVVLEALAIRFPDIMKYIRQYPQNFILTERHFLETKGAESAAIFPETSELKKRLSNEVKEEEHELLLRLLEFLFPIFSEQSLQVDTKDDYERELRICTRDSLFKFLASGRIEGVFSARDAHAFLESQEKRLDFVDLINTRGDWSRWLSWTESFIESSTIESPGHLAELLIETVFQTAKRNSDEGRRLLAIVDSFASTAILYVSDSDAETMFLILATNSKCLSLGLPLLNKATEYTLDNFQPSRKRLLRDLSIGYDGIRLWLEEVRRKAQYPRSLLEELEAIKILAYWKQSGEVGEKEVFDFMSRVFASNSIFDAFLNCIYPGINLQLLDIIVPHPGEFRALCENHRDRESFRKEFWDYLAGPRPDRSDY